MLGIKAGSWASNRGQVKFTALALDTDGQGDQGPARRSPRAIDAGRSARASAWSEDSMPTTTGPTCATWACCAAAAPTSAASCLCDASLSTAGQVELIAQAEGRRGQSGRGRDQHLGHEARRAVVRAGQRRSDRRAAGEEILRARRDREAAGAHAVSRRHGARERRARRRDRHEGREPARQRPDGRAQDRQVVGSRTSTSASSRCADAFATCPGIRFSRGAGRSRSPGRGASGTKDASTRRRRRWSTSPNLRSSSASRRSRSASPSTRCR